MDSAKGEVHEPVEKVSISSVRTEQGSSIKFLL